MWRRCDWGREGSRRGEQKGREVVGLGRELPFLILDPLPRGRGEHVPHRDVRTTRGGGGDTVEILVDSPGDVDRARGVLGVRRGGPPLEQRASHRAQSDVLGITKMGSH